MRFNIKDIVAKNWTAIILIVAAAVLRLYRLPEFMTFLGDQGRDAIIIKRILSLEHFPAIGAPSSIGQIYLGPFYYYFIAPFLLLFNYDPAGLAYGVAFISIAGLIISYVIIHRLTDKFTALTFLALAGFSLVNIELSRYSWNPNLLPLFAFLTLFFFYQLIKTNKILWAVLFGSFLSFSIQLHHLAVFLVFPIIILMIPKRSQLISHFSNLLFSIISFFFFSIPLIIFDLRHDFLNTKNFLKLFSSSQLVGSDPVIYRLFSSIQSLFNHVFRINIPPAVALLLFFTIIFLYYKTHKKSDVFLHLNMLNVIIFLIGFSFLNSPRHFHYYGLIYYSFFLVLAYIISRYKILLFCIFLYVIVNFQGYYFLWNKPSVQIGIARNIAQSIIAEKPQKPYQFISLPTNNTTGHIRYFLELSGKSPLDEDSPEIPKQLFIICYSPSCQVLGNSQWQIAVFTNPKIDKMWNVEGVRIYKLVR